MVGKQHPPFYFLLLDVLLLLKAALASPHFSGQVFRVLCARPRWPRTLQPDRTVQGAGQARWVRRSYPERAQKIQIPNGRER